jgi:hypothetical protein
VQGAAVGSVKHKKLCSNPLRKARLSFEEIKSLAWDTLFSDLDRPCWVQGKVSTGSKAAGRKIPALRTSDPFWPFPITRDVDALPVWKQQVEFRINRLYVGNSFSH